MASKSFAYRGYVIKVTAHELFHGEDFSKRLEGLGVGWYSTAVKIGRYGDDKKLIEEPLHAGRLSITPERALEYGKKFAMQIIDGEIMNSESTEFGLHHAVYGNRDENANKISPTRQTRANGRHV